MKDIRLGRTGIVVPQNTFGARPIQRVTKDEAVALLHRAYDGGMRFFDTARAYSDSEEKVGAAFSAMRDKVYISTKTTASDEKHFWDDLHTSLTLLKTDYIDIYQLHCVPECYGEEHELYQAMIKAKEQGKIRHIGITAHKIGVAEDIVRSGLYETLQFPFSYLASDREIKLARDCAANDIGFIAMKGLSGGLLTNADACMAFMRDFEVLPIWGIQKQEELSDWLRFFEEDISMTDEIRDFIRRDRESLLGEFCRGCGYCMPCTVGITINQCARMSLMLRRAPSHVWLSEHWQNEMMKIGSCVDCGICKTRCPYELDIPSLIRKNLADYREILAGKPV
ncbi:MAG: aldo/keto reductase [Clostridiales bacterium]|nr:aldo/keto reductase [Clostridiales bacterium]